MKLIHTENDNIQALQRNALEEVQAIRREIAGYRAGKPSGVILADTGLAFGQIARLDPTNGAITAYLPRIGAGDVGKTLMVINDSSSANTITVYATPPDSFTSGDSITLTGSESRVTLCALAPEHWVLLGDTTITNASGDSYAGHLWDTPQDPAGTYTDEFDGDMSKWSWYQEPTGTYHDHGITNDQFWMEIGPDSASSTSLHDCHCAYQKIGGSNDPGADFEIQAQFRPDLPYYKNKWGLIVFSQLGSDIGGTDSDLWLILHAWREFSNEPFYIAWGYKYRTWSNETLTWTYQPGVFNWKVAYGNGNEIVLKLTFENTSGTIYTVKPWFSNDGGNAWSNILGSSWTQLDFGGQTGSLWAENIGIFGHSQNNTSDCQVACGVDWFRFRLT